MSNRSGLAEAWALFDRAVERAESEVHANPWCSYTDGRVRFEPDFLTLKRLLAIPVMLDSPTRSGIPARALDVWTAYELRRAGFDEDLVWPRPRPPRILPSTLAALRRGVPRAQRAVLDQILASGKSFDNELGSQAKILGKNYVKQVDVVMSSWRTGPEILISTKRMDSSFGNNAANRVEESYGDAKNLRNRHPLAALGFLYGLRSTAFDEKSGIAEWIVDLLGKLGREDDAYDAVALVVPEWGSRSPAYGGEPDEPEDERPLADAGIENDPSEAEVLPTAIPVSALDKRLDALPEIVLRHDVVPNELAPGTFFETVVNRVLTNSPVNFHTEARRRRLSPVPTA